MVGHEGEKEARVGGIRLIFKNKIWREDYMTYVYGKGGKWEHMCKFTMN